MSVLSIHEKLIPYIQELTKKEKLDSSKYEDKNIIDKLNSAYYDCHLYYPTVNMFRFIAYNIIKREYSLNEIDDNTLNKYLTLVLEDKKLRNLIYHINPTSEFFSTIKDIIPFYLELQKYFKENNRYMVIVTYKKLIDFLDSECLSNYQGHELIEECTKRLDFPNNNYNAYYRYMNEKKYNNKPYEVGMQRNRGFVTSTSKLLARYFHNLMLDFYKKSGFYYSPINDDLAFYSFGTISIVSYKYDDNISMSINNYKWNRYEFWALLNMKGFSLKIDDSKIKDLLLLDSKQLLVVPNGYVEEAFITYLMKELGLKKCTLEFTNILKKIGIPLDYCISHNLETTNGYTYYINPLRYDDLRIKNKENLPIISLIQSKEDDSKRKRYIKKLITTYNEQHKNDEELTPYTRRKINPKAYID